MRAPGSKTENAAQPGVRAAELSESDVDSLMNRLAKERRSVYGVTVVLGVTFYFSYLLFMNMGLIFSREDPLISAEVIEWQLPIEGS